MKKQIPIIAFLMLMNCVSAQKTSTDSVVESLQEIVVTGQFEPQSIKKAVFNVRVITSKDIKQLAANNLGDVLNQYLNINVRPDSQDGSSRVSLFGLDAQYFKILLDNVPLVSDNGFGNNIDLSKINLDEIERIEIIEGSMGVTHGANAVSGILNLISKKATGKKWEIQTTLQEETVNTEYSWFTKGRHIQALKVAHNISDNWYFSAGFNRNDFTGYMADMKGKDHSENDLKRGYAWLPKEQLLGNAILNYHRNDFRFFYRFEYLNEVTDFYNTTVFVIPNPPFEEIRAANDTHFYTGRIYNHANITGKLYSRFSYNISVSYQKQFRDTEAYRYNLNTASEENKKRERNTSTEVYYSTGTFSNFFADKKFDLQLGYETALVKGFSLIIAENNFYKPVNKNINNYDFFVSGEYHATDKFSIRPGVRYSFQSMFDNQYAASMGLRYLLKNDAELRGSFGKSYRTPNFDELYSELIFSGHFFIGNPNLIPENSTSYEASFRKTAALSAHSKITSNISLNYLDIKDKIEMAQIELLPIAKYQYINVTKYRMWNAEGTSQFSYKDFSFSAGASLVAVSQKINNGEAVSDDTFIYTLSLNSSISYAFPKWKTWFSVYYKYNGKQKQYTATNDEDGTPILALSTIDPLNFLDASIRKTFGKDRFELTIGARNILDITNVRQTNPGSGGAHPAGSNILLGYGRSYFLKLMYNLNF